MSGGNVNSSQALSTTDQSPSLTNQSSIAQVKKQRNQNISALYSNIDFVAIPEVYRINLAASKVTKAALNLPPNLHQHTIDKVSVFKTRGSSLHKDAITNAETKHQDLFDAILVNSVQMKSGEQEMIAQAKKDLALRKEFSTSDNGSQLLKQELDRTYNTSPKW